MVVNSTNKTLGIKNSTIAKVKNTKIEEVNKIKDIGLIVTNNLNCTEKGKKQDQPKLYRGAINCEKELVEIKNNASKTKSIENICCTHLKLWLSSLEIIKKRYWNHRKCVKDSNN